MEASALTPANPVVAGLDGPDLYGIHWGLMLFSNGIQWDNNGLDYFYYFTIANFINSNRNLIGSNQLYPIVIVIQSQL